MSKRNIKRILSVFLIFIIAFIGCKPQNITSDTEMIPVSNISQQVEKSEVPEVMLDADGNEIFNSLSDEGLIDYIETDLYDKIVTELNSEDYLVESISAKYISQEYLDELEYNSKSNIYFGYSLEELDKEFQGTRYVFTLGDNGETVVEEFQEYDDTYEQIAKNVAIGTGVILVCVVVSIVSGGTADAVAVIFATAAETGAAVALSDGVLSGVVCGAIEGISSGSLEKGIKVGALEASKSFKWGAIVGCITGGLSKTIALYKLTLNGLTMNQAAFLQKTEKVPESILKQLKSPDEYYEILEKSKEGGIAIDELAKLCKDTDCPLDIAKQLKNADEYYEIVEKVKNGGLTIEEITSMCRETNYPLEIVKLIKSQAEKDIYFDQAGLYYKTINGQVALVRDIDLNYIKEGEELTNLQRMLLGQPPIDPITQKAYELHHIGQNVDSPLAILTYAEHMLGGNNKILHDTNIADGAGVHALLSDSEWAAQKRIFWKAFAETVKP